MIKLSVHRFPGGEMAFSAALAFRESIAQCTNRARPTVLYEE